MSIAGIDLHSTAGAFSKHDPKPQKLLEKILLVTRFHCAPACRHVCHLLLFFLVNISVDGLSGKIGSHGS